MTELFKKLNYKGQELIHLINPPASFTPEMQNMSSHCTIKNSLKNDSISFILAFVRSSAEVLKIVNTLKGQKLNNDPIVWFAYPKKSSRKYETDISRDSGWKPVGELGFEPVRQVAIDEDWSALRFRNPDFIKSMKRDPGMMLSEKGQKRRKDKA